jgi:Family of unknown function (DUF6510)
MSDVDCTLVLDGNAVGGLLQEAFGCEMTACPCQCGHCGAVGALARLLAFTHAPGVVLRCPSCEHVVLRLVRTSEALYLDASGARYLKLPRLSG